MAEYQNRGEQKSHIHGAGSQEFWMGMADTQLSLISYFSRNTSISLTNFMSTDMFKQLEPYTNLQLVVPDAEPF